MTTNGGLAAGMASLPAWLADAPEAYAFDALLAGWVRSSGYRTAGVLWPVEPSPKFVVTAKEDGTQPQSLPPGEWRDMANSLRSSSGTAVWQVPNTSGRLYAMLAPPGRPPGMVWVERPVGEPWTELDRNYLKLSARLIERSMAFGNRAGLFVDPERLQQRLRDASIIAGRMAHDFDNILTGIIGFTDLTVPLLPAGGQAARFLGEISKVGQRGIQFTQQLHSLSRSGQTKPLPSNLAGAVAKEDARLRKQYPVGPDVEIDVPAGLAAVALDAEPLHTVLGQILDNALEAVPATGPVTIAARAVELNNTDAKSYLGQVSAGAHIEVTVQDRGPGIKSDVRAKLFVEPFVTTKVRHRGLGLAVVYRTLFAHRGGIRIDAAPETGTVVRVVIPLATIRPAVVAAAAHPVPFHRG